VEFAFSNHGANVSLRVMVLVLQGIVHIAFSKSISDHLANLSSLERMKMSNVSFTANFVSFLPLKLSIRSKSSENRSNGKAGLWVLLATQ
jgi:hypothetical protein